MSTCHPQLAVIGVLVFMFPAPDLASAQIAKKSPYNHRETAEYRDLDPASRSKLDQVVKDFAALEQALNQFMSEHLDQPPGSLSELVPKYLKTLPKDPFAAEGSEVRDEWKHYAPSVGGAGYLYQRRPGPSYVTAWKPTITMRTQEGSWRIRSVGLPDFPLRYDSKNGRGLIRSKGYWGRMMLDVF